MGCDIHPYAEVRVDGVWTRAKVKVPCDRNYLAFAKLAGVRNGVGFAGTDTGDPVTPIAEPRGLPADIAWQDTGDNVAYKDADYCWLGDHSHSWVTLAELLAVDYTEPVTLRGFVKPEVAKNFRERGYAPREWCSWTSDQTWEQIEWQEPLYRAATVLPEILFTLMRLGSPNDVRLVFGFDS